MNSGFTKRRKYSGFMLITWVHKLQNTKAKGGLRVYLTKPHYPANFKS